MKKTASEIADGVLEKVGLSRGTARRVLVERTEKGLRDFVEDFIQRGTRKGVDPHIIKQKLNANLLLNEGLSTRGAPDVSRFKRTYEKAFGSSFSPETQQYLLSYDAIQNLAKSLGR